jgi:HlyD family secretion protein
MPAQSDKGGGAIFWGSLLLAASVGFGLGGFCVYHFYVPRNDTTTADESVASEEAADTVVARGRIQPRNGILSLGVPTPDRIRQLKVKEGDRVEKDAPLVVLDSEVMRGLEWESAKIQRQQAKARLEAITANGEAQIHVEELRRDQIDKLAPIEIKALRSKIDFLKVQEENAVANYKHMEAAGDTIAAQDKEKQKLAGRQVNSEYIATESQLTKLTTSNALNLRLADAQLLAARAELKQSQSAISLDLLDTQIKEAKERLNETQIHAPTKGKILRLFVHEGELVHGGPILQMADVENMIVLAEVYETDINRVKEKQKATITSRIFQKGKNELTGRVFWIASSVGKAQTTPLDPRAAVDNRIVEVKIALDKPGDAAHLIDHQVTVAIDTTSTNSSHPDRDGR